MCDTCITKRINNKWYHGVGCTLYYVLDIISRARYVVCTVCLAKVEYLILYSRYCLYDFQNLSTINKRDHWFNKMFIEYFFFFNKINCSIRKHCWTTCASMKNTNQYKNMFCKHKNEQSRDKCFEENTHRLYNFWRNYV